MSKLYTFGCSFSEDFNPFYQKDDTNKSLRTDYIHNHLMGQIPLSWPEILSKKLNLDCELYAAINSEQKSEDKFGNANTSIFYNFCQTIDKIDNNDVVIIEWTFLERYIWVDEFTNHFVTVLPNQYPNNEIPAIAYEHMLVNKANVNWYKEIKQYEKVITELSKYKNFKVYFWSIDDRYYEYFYGKIKDDKKYLINDLINQHTKFLTTIKNHGGRTIAEETNNKIIDSHFGASGHAVIAELFYKHITNE